MVRGVPFSLNLTRTFELTHGLIVSYLEEHYHRGLFRDMTTALSGKVLWETHGSLFPNR